MTAKTISYVKLRPILQAFREGKLGKDEAVAAIWAASSDQRGGKLG